MLIESDICASMMVSLEHHENQKHQHWNDLG